MEFVVSLIAIALMLIGAFGVIFLKKPLDKVIMFSIMDAGFLLVVVLFKYLDVAMFVALSDPLCTLIFIMAIVKIKEIRQRKVKSGELHDYVNLFFYVGIFLAIVGSLATAWGPGVKDPIIRTFNTEVASIGVCLVLLTYNHVLALLTLLATTVVITFVLFRAIIRLEEMGADV